MTIQAAIHNTLVFLGDFDSNITKWFSEADQAMKKIKAAKDDGTPEAADDIRKIVKRFEKKNDDGTERHETIMREMEDFDKEFDMFMEAITIVNVNKNDEIIINHSRVLRDYHHTFIDLHHDIKKDYDDWQDDVKDYMKDKEYQKFLGARRVLEPIEKIMVSIEKVNSKLENFK